jgi:hypothetical protein
MEELTAETADERAKQAATYLVQQLEMLNQKQTGPSPILDQRSMLPIFTGLFVRLLSNRYVIVPGNP